MHNANIFVVARITAVSFKLNNFVEILSDTKLQIDIELYGLVKSD